MYNWISNQTNTITHIGLSPAPHILEHEVVEAFARLDAHLWIGVSRSSCDVIPLVFPDSFDALPIPTIFTSLKEAKLSLDNIISRLFLDKVSGPSAPSLTSISQYAISEASEPPFAKELRSWTSAFQPIFDITQSRIDRDPKDHSEFIPAGILHLYSEIIAVFRAIVNHPACINSFIFECGFIPQLFVVDAGGRREGIWDAKTVGLVGADILRCEAFDEHVRNLQNQYDVPSTGDHLSAEGIIGNDTSAWDDYEATGNEAEEVTNNKEGVEHPWERYNDEVEEMHLLDWVKQYLGPQGDGLVS
ncbi:hypothetical protein BOTCAL_1095g00010 [Botryotinia calthae]|uniref:Uncharacterized protein n=1 Tax=Botryotinia calthae TaxID=38488 RepID=A0A4Y8CE57_9HELO|nr:hypothetical protein BOTCAL_1095g00010 [Botryotinia calthae]